MSNFTKFPNTIIDNVLPQVSPNGWKLFCFIWRKTAGWQKDNDDISYSQMMAGCNISSKTTLKKAIDELAPHIAITPGRGRSQMYNFNISQWLEPPDKGPETVPIKGTETEPFNGNSPETVPFNEDKGPETVPITDEKGPETVHTKESHVTSNIREREKNARAPRNEDRYRQVALKILWVTDQKREYLDDKGLAELNRVTNWLIRANVTDGQLEFFKKAWWGWAKSPPRIKQIQTEWSSAMAKMEKPERENKSDVDETAKKAYQEIEQLFTSKSYPAAAT